MSVSQWVFPPVANPTFFPNNYLKDNIVTFLNRSTTFWPSSGFGKTAVYQNDSLTFQVQNRTFASTGFVGQLHCMPCRQKLGSTDEALNWDACRYGRNDNLAALISIDIGFPARDLGSSITADWNVNNVYPLPESTKSQALMCTVGLQGRDAYEITVPFRLVNADREAETSDSMYTFDTNRPEGTPTQDPTTGGSRPSPTGFSNANDDDGDDDDDEHHGLRSAEIAGVVVGAGLAGVGVFFAVCWFIFKRKRSPKTATAAAPSKDEMSKEEEAAGDVLPGYERPPEYVEAVRAEAK